MISPTFPSDYGFSGSDGNLVGFDRLGVSNAKPPSENNSRSSSHDRVIAIIAVSDNTVYIDQGAR